MFTFELKFPARLLILRSSSPNANYYRGASRKGEYICKENGKSYIIQ
jgi:hypothetical protein